VLASIPGEVGTLCTVLLNDYSGTCLPIFIQIGSYLTDTEQKVCWHVLFLRHGVYVNCTKGVTMKTNKKFSEVSSDFEAVSLISAFIMLRSIRSE